MVKSLYIRDQNLRLYEKNGSEEKGTVWRQIFENLASQTINCLNLLMSIVAVTFVKPSGGRLVTPADCFIARRGVITEQDNDKVRVATSLEELSKARVLTPALYPELDSGSELC